jgi:hypothetical protein
LSFNILEILQRLWNRRCRRTESGTGVRKEQTAALIVPLICILRRWEDILTAGRRLCGQGLTNHWIH